MKLHALPLLMEGFHQVQADAGPPGRWYINRWATIPEEWVWDFCRAERILGKLTGRLFTTADGEELTGVQWVYEGSLDITDVHGITQYVTEEEWLFVQQLLNDFFDGDDSSRHQRMQELFICTEYSV